MITKLFIFTINIIMEKSTTDHHPKVTVFVAHGSEEIETVSVIDILRRAEF